MEYVQPMCDAYNTAIATIMCPPPRATLDELQLRFEHDLFAVTLEHLAHDGRLRLAVAASRRSPNRALADCTCADGVREKLCWLVFSPYTLTARFPMRSHMI